jgi:hypothetical protein
MWILFRVLFKLEVVTTTLSWSSQCSCVCHNDMVDRSHDKKTTKPQHSEGMVCCKWRLRNEHYQWMRWMTACGDIGCSLYRIFMRVLGPIMFVSANLLIGSVAVLFFWYFIPEFFKNSSLLYLFHMLFGFYLCINIFFNYFLCAFTPPGSPSYCPDPGRILGEKVSIVDGRKIYQFSYQLQIAPFVSYRYCHQCKCIKPPRAHHDRFGRFFLLWFRW